MSGNTGKKEDRTNVSEKELNWTIRLALGRLPHVRLFANPCGLAWVGYQRGPIRGGGRVTLERARQIHFGLCDGSSDIIGWRQIEITPDMVGQRIAQFVSLEVKSKYGRVRLEQKKWLDFVRAHGGVAQVVRSLDDAFQAIRS